MDLSDAEDIVQDAMAPAQCGLALDIWMVRMQKSPQPDHGLCGDDR